MESFQFRRRAFYKVYIAGEKARLVSFAQKSLGLAERRSTVHCIGLQGLESRERLVFQVKLPHSAHLQIGIDGLHWRIA